MPTSRTSGAAGAINSIIYLAVGTFGCCTFLNSTDAYDPSTNTWVAKSNLLPFGSTGAASAVLNGRLYVVGGSFGSSIARCEEYDPGANLWYHKADLPQSLNRGASAGVNGVLYFAGGSTSGSNYTPSAFALDPSIFYLHEKN